MFVGFAVFDDLGEITRRHFKGLQTLVQQRRQQETQKQYLDTSSHQNLQDRQPRAAKQLSTNYDAYGQSQVQYR